MILPLEQTRRHNWHHAEREFICVMFRYFERQPEGFAQVFNTTFGLNLKSSKVIAQFDSQLLYYGPEAMPEYKAVFSPPFLDPGQEITAMRQSIQRTAKSLGIKLVRFREEARSASGTARTSESPRIRKRYRQLVKAAKRRQSSNAKAPVQKQQPFTPLVLGGVTLSTNENFETSEILVESAEFPSPCPMLLERPSPGHKDTPKLVFRVWDATSLSIFTEDHGFVAGAFTSWAGPFPPPFAPEGLGKQALTIFMNTHLSMQGGSSTFVSTTTSLLQALTKASAMMRPHIAVIDLSHPSLSGVPHKVLHAADCLRDLKGQGQAWWARYKGHTEYMIFADIPRKSILKHFSLADLIALYDSDQTVANFLSLEKFVSGLKTQTLSTQLRERNIVLDARYASAMGSIASLFGLDGSVKIKHVEEFVSRIVDGWHIISATDINMQQFGVAFARSLSSRFHGTKEVCDAFEEGIKVGNETLAYFAKRRRPGARRVRTI